VRELRNNPTWQWEAIGFLDDDPLKSGKVIHGLRVLGGNGAFVAICREQEVDEVLVSTAKIAPERIRHVLQECSRAGIVLTRARFQIERLSAVSES
jgi:UDP-GlcNAc:undecaprenyl-phosphate GlcNAc-1-phosphate transferase